MLSHCVSLTTDRRPWAQVGAASYVWLPLLPKGDGSGYELRWMPEWSPKDVRGLTAGGASESALIRLVRGARLKLQLAWSSMAWMVSSAPPKQGPVKLRACGLSMDNDDQSIVTAGT